MNYLITGEPCVDVIHKANGETLHSYGGILYSVISMAVMSDDADSVTPIMNLGEDEYENIIDILKKYPKIKIHGINKVKHPTRQVNLFYDMYNADKSARVEKSTEPTRTLDYLQCESYFHMADAILINMISGVDISIETLKNMRKNYKGLIHLDIHNVVMDTREDGSRVHTAVENWYEWCTNADTIQMNEFEIATLTKDKLSEYKIAEKILFNNNYHVKGLIVTRGKQGVTGFVKSEKSFEAEKFVDIDRCELAAVENPHFVDSTGCGDVFASAFTLEYSKNKDFEKSIHIANRKASLNASLNGIDELLRLK